MAHLCWSKLVSMVRPMPYLGPRGELNLLHISMQIPKVDCPAISCPAVVPPCNLMCIAGSRCVIDYKQLNSQGCRTCPTPKCTPVPQIRYME